MFTTILFSAALIASAVFAWAVIARTRIAKEIEALKRVDDVIRGELGEIKASMAEMTAKFTQRNEAQERKMAGELQMLEGLIREFAGNIARVSKDVPHEKQTAITRTAKKPGRAYAQSLADPDMLEIIRRSLEENRVDLYLQPTVSLPQRKVRFYEALSRLRAEDGTVIMPAQYIRVAAPAGLMSVVDNLLLFRCVQIVRRLMQKRRDIGVFCNISGHTLTDTEFFPQFLAFMRDHRDLAGQFVFEFTEESILKAGGAEETNLRALSELGFALSMDQVTRLDLDFAKLKGLGIRHIKVRADTLLSGMRAANATVDAEDLKDLLARNAINLIAERIEDEKTVVQLLEYDVDFGQGYLFGEPRPVRDVTDPKEPRAPAQTTNAIALAGGLARRLTG